MRWVLRIAVALTALAVLGLGLLAIALPRIVDSAAVRGRIEAAARDALGRDLRYRDLDFGLLPPSLLVLEPQIAGEAPADPAFAQAQRVALRVALLPLLARRVVVDSLVVEGATLRLVRTAEGLQLPRPGRIRGGDERAAEAGEGSASAPADEGPAGGVALAVRRVALRDTTVQLDDRAVSPRVAWQLEVPSFEATGSRPDAPVAVAGSVRLASGGEIGVSGSVTLDGALDLDLSLREVALEPLEPYLRGAAPRLRLGGRLGGDIELAGPAADPGPVTLKLAIAEARLAAAGVDATGPLGVEAQLAHLRSGPTGPFRIDATGARLAYGPTFLKPPGTTAALEGSLVADARGAPGVDDLALTLRNLVLRGSARSASSPVAELRADAFELAGWEQLVPALARSPLSGSLALPGLRVATAPFGLTGAVELRDVVVPLAGRAPLVARGTIEARGTQLRAPDLQVVVAEQPFRVEATLRDLAAAPRFEVELAGRDLDSNALLAALAGQPDRLYGPLALTGTLGGRVGERPLLEALSGRLGFGVEGGRIVGVSLLEAVFAKLGALRSLALDAGRVFGGRDLQRFYGDDFERLTGHLRVADGKVLADELSFLYRGYRADLTGVVSLADLALDLRGTLTILGEVDAEIARRAGLGADYVPRSRELPLAAVRGSLGAPEVQLAPAAALRFATAYASDALQDRLGREVDKELGPEAGEAARRGIGVLEDLLGGKQRR